VKKRVELQLELDQFRRGLRSANDQLDETSRKVVDSGKRMSNAFNATWRGRNTPKEQIRNLKKYTSELDAQFKEIKRRRPFEGQDEELKSIQRHMSGVSKRAQDIKADTKQMTDELIKFRSHTARLTQKQEYERLQLQIKKAEKELSELNNEGKESQGVFSRLSRKMRGFGNRTERVSKQANKFSGIMNTWWERFGAVAIGFTVAYRAMNAFENVIYETVEIMRDAILASGELSSLQGELAGYYTLSTGKIENFNKALNDARGNVNALAMASTKSVSTIDELVTGYSELAQHGVYIQENMMDEFTAFNDMLVQVAKSTGSTTKQIRSEWQGLLEGQERATNAMLRMLRNIGVLSEEEVKMLKGIGDEAAIVEKILERTGEAAKRVQEEMLQRNVAAAMRNWKAAMQQSIVAAQQLAAEGENVGNIFGKTIYDHIERVNKKFYELGNQEAFISLLEKINWGIDKALTVMERFILGLGKLSVILDNLSPQLKTAVKTIFAMEAGLVGLKVLKVIGSLFRRLNSVLITSVENMFTWQAAVLATTAAAYGLITAIRALKLSIPESFSKNLETALDSVKEKMNEVRKEYEKTGDPKLFEQQINLEASKKEIKELIRLRDKLGDVPETQIPDAYRNYKKAMGEDLPSFGERFLNKAKQDAEYIGEGLGAVVNIITDKITELSKTPDAFYGDLPSHIGLGAGTNKYLDMVKETSNKLTEAHKELMKSGDALTKKMRNDVEILNDSLKEAHDLFMAGAISEETFQRAVDAANKRYLDQMETDTEKSFNYMEEFSKQTAENMSSNFSDFFFDAFTGQLDSAVDYFRSFAKSILRVWADMEAKMMASELFGSAFMGGESSKMGGIVGGLISGVAGMFGGGGAGGGAGGFNYGTLPEAIGPGRASGGPVAANETYVVGEKGPEVLSMGNRSGHITPNNQLAPRIELNVINNTGEDAETSASDPQWDGERWVMNVVLDAANKNKNGFGRGLSAALSKFR